MLLRLITLAGLLLAQTGLGTGSISPGANGRANLPNILFVLADDLGYGDLSCQNPNSKIRTPHLDRLATQGVRFTDAHASSALCTPSRYSILTGQYCWRSRLKSGVLNMWDEPLIAPERLTMAGMLRGAGYKTACFGKWHLGLSWPFRGAVPTGFDIQVQPQDLNWQGRLIGGPVDCGFDYYYGVNIPNQPPYVFIENDHVTKPPDRFYSTVRGQQGHWGGPGVTGWDWEQVLPCINSNTVRWIETNAGSNSAPFFLYAALVGPHQPVLPDPRFRGTSQAGVYGDYVQEIDSAVGDLLDALDRAGVADRTLVIFSSDNGPDEYAYSRIQQYGHTSMGPLRGVKSDIWEGGHRVPLIARWPGVITNGVVSQQPVCLVDLMRTAAELTGTALPANAAEDSVSFLPALLGASTNQERSGSWVLESGLGQFGLRFNHWMYIASSTGDGHNPELEPLWFEQSRNYLNQSVSPALLYNLSQDLGERVNLLQQQNSVAAQLGSTLQQRRACTTWTGKVSADWALPQNWFPEISLDGADVVYSNSVGEVTQVLGQTLSLNSIGVDASVNGNLNLVSLPGAGLLLANGIDVSRAPLNLKLHVPVTLNQSQCWSVGSGQVLESDGALDLGDYTLTLVGAGNTVFSNTIYGNGALRIRSPGVTVLGASNSFKGGLELSGGGAIVVQTDGSLGTGPLAIPNNSTLYLDPAVTITNRASIEGYGIFSNAVWQGALSLRAPGLAAYRGPISLTGNSGLRAATSGSALVIGGSITGTGNLSILPGQGVVVFRTNQYYSGRTVIESRLILAGGPDRMPTTTEVLFANSPSAQLDLGDHDQTVAAIRGGGAAGGNLMLGTGSLKIGPVRNAVYAGSISGTGGLEKFGPASLILEGVNAYTGGTTVNDGSLVVNGSLLNSPVTVRKGALSGRGSIGGPVRVAAGGALSVTHANEVLTVGSNLELSQGAITMMTFDSARGANAQVQVQNSISYGGTLLLSNMSPAIALTNGQSFHLFSSVFANGSFSTIQPAPGPGLAWRFNPGKGVLTAVARPVLSWKQANSSTAIMSWTGTGLHLQVLTNQAGLATPAQWLDYPGGSVSPVRLAIDPKQPCVLVRLVGQ